MLPMLACAMFAPLLQLPIVPGASTGALAMAGDAAASIVKRRLGIAAIGLLYFALEIPPAGRTASGCATGPIERAVRPRWEHFDHGADIGVRGWGPSESAAFEQAALALTAVVTEPRAVAAHTAVPIRCQAADDELLLAAWLNALVYEMAVRRMLFSRFEVLIDGHRLQAVAHGEPVDVARHRPAVEVKGATLTALRVAREGDGWLAQMVVDV